ncbi:beta-lactamase family protein (plasmid) [Streptomyces clavuligerus]|nr:serine hydrolase domain-containing protein [Streptomyces clavuligerus]WDN56379.1 beta-lactamase family protein [Streptomyces clavuligerus]
MTLVTAVGGHAAPLPRFGSALQADVDAIRATGTTGVLAEVRSPRGRASARAGVADLEHDGPVPWNAYYRIGSDTKTYTAALVLQLVGEGRLRLTDTVERWLPGMVRGNGNDGSRITVANLLRQTSGLNDYLSLSGGSPFTPNAYRRNRFRPGIPQKQVMAALSKPPLWVPDAADPAEERRWGYSNTNYVLAGMIVERVTGNPWAHEIHERFILPLKLRNTLVPGTSSYVPQPTAVAYTQFPGATGLTDTTVASAGAADGGIISTPHDVTVFLRALLSGRLLAPAQIAAMKRTVPAADYGPPGTGYGLGLAWRPGAGGSGVWFHGGTHLGVVSETGVTSDGGTAVAAALFTLPTEAAQADAQSRAAQRLVDRALG